MLLLLNKTCGPDLHAAAVCVSFLGTLAAAGAEMLLAANTGEPQPSLHCGASREQEAAAAFGLRWIPSGDLT